MHRIVIALSICVSFLAVGVGTAHQAAANGVKAGWDRPQIMMGLRGNGRHGGGGGSKNMYYHGGNPGVETGADKVYLVFWGAQWNSNNLGDPSGEATIEQNFFSGVGGSSWNNTVTQYCEGVPVGTYFCNGAGTAATNPTGVYADTWYDNTANAPSNPSQSQLAAEAAKAAAHFGNTTAASNMQAQYVINTATHNSESGFGTSWCAWHSSTSSGSDNIAYTYMPYITDAGASCGANFVNGGSAGATDGITIVGGHEFAETETDIFPNGGWLDGSNGEIGDKCAWLNSGTGAATNISLSTGTFPVQSLWSNRANNNAGGCVTS